MKRLILLLLAVAAFSLVQAEEVYFGYSPQTVFSENLVAIGSGKSNTLDAAICLDPATDPVVTRLKGQKVKGVRIFVRQDYTGSQQASNRYVFFTNDLSATPTKTQCKFYEGWNEVNFSEPVTIGDASLYIGARIYETFGTPYPFCAYSGASASNGYFVRAGKDSEWVSSSDNSVLLIQAVLEDDGTLSTADGPLSASAHVSFSDAPLTVRPDALMSGMLYVHNQGPEALNALTFETCDTRLVKHSYTLDFGNEPLPAYDGRSISYEVYAPSMEGTNRPLTFSVTDIQTVNSDKVVDATGRSISFTGSYYVMQDAFVRVPLVEEFTSQYCPNCPMMSYYLDAAIEQWRESGKPLVYVTHHTGFANDMFTQPTDVSLQYLFGSAGDTYNPAAMYDRRVFSGEDTPMQTAQVAEVSPYTEHIEAVNNVAALADVQISLSDDGKKVTVKGGVNRNFALEEIPAYITCYLIEDGIPTTPYFQEGLDLDGAPDDLVDRFHHNGVVRHVFTTAGTGDLLDIECDGDAYFYEVTYDYPEKVSPLKILNKENTSIVAFVHLYDPDVLQNNYVLNAGSLSLATGSDGIANIRMADGKRAPLFDLSGRRINAPSVGQLYICNGKKFVRK